MKIETHQAGVLQYQKNPRSRAVSTAQRSGEAIVGQQAACPGRGLGSWRLSTQKESHRR